MNTEALSVQLRIISQAAEVVLDLASNNRIAAEEKLFFISEDLGHLKVLVGVNDSNFKKLESINNSFKSKVVTAKSKEAEYI